MQEATYSGDRLEVPYDKDMVIPRIGLVRMGKIVVAAAGAVGYVLGARAGRERYEQIKSQVSRLWQNPKVQQAATRAEGLARDTAPRVQQKVADSASTQRKQALHERQLAISRELAAQAEATKAARSTTGRGGHAATTEGASERRGAGSPGGDATAGGATRG